MRFGRKTSFAAGAVAALVLGSGTAYAATGGNFILGKSNTAGATTSLTNANGTALNLNAKSGTPALHVNTTAKVANLNADKLDGVDSTQFALATGGVKAYDFTGVGHDYDGDGKVDTIVATAGCPAGTLRTGGGSVDNTTSGYVFYDGPDSTGTWVVAAAVDPTVTEDPTNLTASVVCLGLRGAPTGGYRMAAPEPSSTTLAEIAYTAQHKRFR